MVFALAQPHSSYSKSFPSLFFFNIVSILIKVTILTSLPGLEHQEVSFTESLSCQRKPLQHPKILKLKDLHRDQTLSIPLPRWNPSTGWVQSAVNQDISSYGKYQLKQLQGGRATEPEKPQQVKGP